jgi:hypothetical protein
MKRWAICKLEDYEGNGDLVPKFNLYNCNSRIWSKAGMTWCFGQIGSNNIAAIQADPDIYVLPDGTMDMMVSAIPAATRTTMKNKLEAAGFVFTAVKTTWTSRQVLQYLHGQIQTAGDIEAGDVQDQEG